jgi:hypothetical protein
MCFYIILTINKISAKQAASDLGYSLVVFAGLAVFGFAGYLLFCELGSRETPTGIYNESSKICLQNYQVWD